MYAQNRTCFSTKDNIFTSIHLKWIDEFIDEISVFGWKPEELSPVLYINLSVAKNFPFYVKDIWKVRSCKTCISTLRTINLQTKTCKINLILVYLKIPNDQWFRNMKFERIDMDLEIVSVLSLRLTMWRDISYHTRRTHVSKSHRRFLIVTKYLNDFQNTKYEWIWHALR